MLLRQISSKWKGDLNYPSLDTNEFGAKQIHGLLPGKALFYLCRKRWVDWWKGHVPFVIFIHTRFQPGDRLAIRLPFGH